VVLSLAYYGCPMLCTLSLNGLASALKTLVLRRGPRVRGGDRQLRAEGDAAQAAAAKKTYLERYGRPPRLRAGIS
jgi:hypothetical protein